MDAFGLARSGKPIKLGGGNSVRIDNPHVTEQQKYAHVNTPKGSVVVNQDGSQSHKGKGSLKNINKIMKKFVKGKGFKIPSFPLLLNPCLFDPYMLGCGNDPFQCPDA